VPLNPLQHKRKQAHSSIHKICRLVISVSRVASNRGGIIVAAASAESDVELWELNTRKQLPKSPLQGHNSMIDSIAFGVAGQLATGGVDATLRL
jgi:WD40 repeat protein